MTSILQPTPVATQVVNQNIAVPRDLTKNYYARQFRVCTPRVWHRQLVLGHRRFLLFRHMRSVHRVLHKFLCSSLPAKPTSVCARVHYCNWSLTPHQHVTEGSDFQL